MSRTIEPLLARAASRLPWCRVRKMPIPFVTEIPEDHPVVKFAVENRKRVLLCGRKSLCQFCGLRLDEVIVFLGGEMATAQRLFRQAPFHERCARYAVEACPYLRNTLDPQFATFCRHFKMQDAVFPLTDPTAPVVMKAFTAHAIVRVEPVGKWTTQTQPE